MVSREEIRKRFPNGSTVAYKVRRRNGAYFSELFVDGVPTMRQPVFKQGGHDTHRLNRFAFFCLISGRDPRTEPYSILGEDKFINEAFATYGIRLEPGHNDRLGDPTWTVQWIG